MTVEATPMRASDFVLWLMRPLRGTPKPIVGSAVNPRLVVEQDAAADKLIDDMRELDSALRKITHPERRND